MKAMRTQNRWLFEALFIPDENHNTLPLASLSLFEGDAMTVRVRGRSKPKRGVIPIKLYHYSPIIIRDFIKPFSRWTDMSFGSRYIQDVARMTGLQTDKIKYRYELVIPENYLNYYFHNVATKMLPGLGSASEYVNQQSIPINWIEKIIVMGQSRLLNRDSETEFDIPVYGCTPCVAGRKICRKKIVPDDGSCSYIFWDTWRCKC
jgi:hypothetical protein